VAGRFAMLTFSLERMVDFEILKLTDTILQLRATDLVKRADWFVSWLICTIQWTGWRRRRSAKVSWRTMSMQWGVCLYWIVRATSKLEEHFLESAWQRFGKLLKYTNGYDCKGESSLLIGQTIRIRASFGRTKSKLVSETNVAGTRIQLRSSSVKWHPHYRVWMTTIEWNNRGEMPACWTFRQFLDVRLPVKSP
jgi:hypothetical protein